MLHGRSGYTNHGCRCSICTKAQREYCRALRRYATAEQVEKALKAQKNRCAICGVKAGGEAHFDADHDHATQQFRGMLCRRCNLGLGHFQDNPERLRAAAAYLDGI